jgi:hypothetical protein
VREEEKAMGTSGADGGEVDEEKEGRESKLRVLKVVVVVGEGGGGRGVGGGEGEVNQRAGTGLRDGHVMMQSESICSNELLWDM